jgi:3-oxoadipate CoA-transferase beta subunit
LSVVPGCVTRVYTDHAVFDIVDGRFRVREAFGDNTVASLAELTGRELIETADAAASLNGE